MTTTKPTGLECPHCGGLTRVIKTWTRKRGIVARRRQCVSCAAKISTDEKQIGVARAADDIPAENEDA